MSGLSQTNGMEIRTLGQDDATAYWELRYEALQAEPLAFGKAAEEHRTTTIEETATRIRELPEHSFILGGFENGTLIGMAMFMRETGLKERHKGHIYGVYVTARHRHNGLGYKLIAALLGKAREDASLEHVLLAVSVRQAAAFRLYRRFGFQTYGTEPKALKVVSEYVDEIQMLLKIR